MGRKPEPTGIWTRAVGEAIDTVWKIKNAPPSMREIMRMTGITSPHVVSYEYRRLATQGIIDIVDGKPVPRWVVARLSSMK